MNRTKYFFKISCNLENWIFTSCKMVTDVYDRTPCISDHNWYYHLGKATLFFRTYWFCFHVKFMIWLTFQFAKWKTIGKWIAKVSVTCFKVVWLHKKLDKELRTLIKGPSINYVVSKLAVFTPSVSKKLRQSAVVNVFQPFFILIHIFYYF